MNLPNVKIVIGSGSMGNVTLSDDGISGMILTGTAVPEKLELNKVYVLGGMTDLKKYGIEEKTNPLLVKDLTAFYSAAGEGAELHLLVVSEATTLTQICANEDGSPLNRLINSSAGRIRLVGINRNTPFRVFIPAIGWTGETDGLYQPREGSCNRIAVVMASDGKIGESKLYSAAIGQVLGRTAKISVHQNLGRVRDGAIASTGYMTDGKTPEEHFSELGILNDAGYIFYRTYIGKNGYYLNGDAMAAPTTDSYCYLSSGRVIDKAAVIAYRTYIDEILDNIEVDPESGTIPTAICKSFEASIIRAVNTNMNGEISSFTAYIDPSQNILANGHMEITCKIVPLATLREITVNLSLENPA